MITMMGLQELGDVDDATVLDCDNNATGDDEQRDMCMTSA